MAIQTKVNASDLPNLIGQTVIVRSNVDNSQKRGTVLAYDATKQAVQIDQNKSHFWQSVSNSSGVYIYTVK